MCKYLCAENTLFEAYNTVYDNKKTIYGLKKTVYDNKKHCLSLCYSPPST